MHFRLTPFVVVAVIMAIFGAQTACYYGLMPRLMASHFGLLGQPDGWMPKPSFFLTSALFLFIITTFLSLITLLLRVVPTELINLPNKAYWLSPERRSQTLRRLSSYMLSMALATGMLQLTIFQMVLTANLMGSPHLGLAPLGATAIFLGWMVSWMTSLVRVFQVPRD